MLIWSAGVLTRFVGVSVFSGISVSVAAGMFVFVGKKVGMDVAEDAAGVEVAPKMTGVGLKMAGVRVGGIRGVGGL
jgi:hypothetical protein